MFNNRRIDDRLAELTHLVSRIETALVVRDPGNAMAAEAYEGLRRNVVASMRERRSHLMQLVRFEDALDRGVDPEGLRQLVHEWSLQAGLERCTDTSREDFFEILADGDGDELIVERPAWVDAAGETPVLVQLGLARRTGGRAGVAPAQTLGMDRTESLADGPVPNEPDISPQRDVTPEDSGGEGQDKSANSEAARSNGEGIAP